MVDRVTGIRAAHVLSHLHFDHAASWRPVPQSHAALRANTVSMVLVTRECVDGHAGFGKPHFNNFVMKLMFSRLGHRDRGCRAGGPGEIPQVYYP